ncbi:hypothetical protein HPP92_019143 [Vanilla planifolia]|uniref:Uncharacterized protein n=1 Tax=Vanilla planifolia TaxID=51239 RepID=A0A835QA46_VANPL|nr:hypothetical protein HPP92_019143 [Vanilla planifolia]
MLMPKQKVQKECKPAETGETRVFLVLKRNSRPSPAGSTAVASKRTHSVAARRTYQWWNLEFIPMNLSKLGMLNIQDKTNQVLKRMVSLGDVDSYSKSQLPKVDFSGLNQTKLGTPSWVWARNEVLRALKYYGGFEVVYDPIGTQICEGLLGRAVPELFAQKGSTELVSPTQVPLHGPWIYTEGTPFLGIQLANLDSASAMEEHVNSIWPQGNTYFRLLLGEELRQSFSQEFVVDFQWNKVIDSFETSIGFQSSQNLGSDNGPV